MTLYNKNIETIKKHGFENMNFSGYGGTGYKKGDLQIWWGEWGYAYIETWGRPERAEIQLGLGEDLRGQKYNLAKYPQMTYQIN